MKVEIGKFKHKKTGEIGFSVMKVSTPFASVTHNYVYNAGEWEKVNTVELEGAERIVECLFEDIEARKSAIAKAEAELLIKDLKGEK